MAGRVGDQIERWIGDEERDGMSHEEIADRIKQLTKRYATVCATSEELQGIVDTTPELKTIIEKIARSRASCAVNEDHFDVVLGETRNFLFELVLGAISLDEYGWAMEKYLHHGSVAVYNACKLPTREQNSGAIGLLTGVTTIIPVTTWAQHINTIWTHIEVSGIDAATLAASKPIA